MKETIMKKKMVNDKSMLLFGEKKLEYFIIEMKLTSRKEIKSSIKNKTQ